MYECPICYSLNHSSRLHCSHCGAVPAMYSLSGKAVTTRVTLSGNYQHEIVAAKGCERAIQHHAQRVYLRTMPLDYYANE